MSDGNGETPVIRVTEDGPYALEGAHQHERNGVGLTEGAVE